MKAIHLKCVTALAMSMSACACIPSVEAPAQTATPAPPPVAMPVPTPAPAPAPAPVPVVNEPAYDNYLDAPQTPGTWTYIDRPNARMAVFGAQASQADFAIRCTGSQIALMRALPAPPTSIRAMSIKTETVTRNLSANPMPSGGPLASNFVAASLDPNDPVLDAMAITKGRVAIGVEGMRTLYIPAWVEISRVIEDCR